MSSVAVEELAKSYGKVRAVDGVSLAVGAGQFVVLLGPSGSGKTTLLRCIAGLEKPDAGRVLVGSEVVNDLTPAERNMSMVFQSYALFPLMSVRENIAFPLRVRHAPRDQMESRVRAVAEKLGIAPLLDKSPRQLSGGEQQRVAIARAIVRDTNALLMDEPLSSLDAPLRAQMRIELKTIQKQIGATIVYVTHDQVEAMTLADRIGVLDRGRLLQFGTPDEVYNRPACVFVARFVGSPPANIVEVAASRKGDVLYYEGNAFFVRANDAAAAPRGTAEGRKTLLGIRPEAISLSSSQAEGSFEAVVELVEPLGPNAIVLVRAGEAVFKVLTSSEFDGRVGDRLWATMDPQKVLLFDSETELLVA